MSPRLFSAAKIMKGVPLPGGHLLAAAVLVCCLQAGSLPLGAATTETAIESVLNRQVEAWNSGDLPEFVSSYASRCTLVGRQISTVSRAQVLKHYREKYPNLGAMGKLTFSHLAVYPLDVRIAMVTGNWHLDRNTASGGPIGGVFSLVCERIGGSWQIVLDHTS